MVDDPPSSSSSLVKTRRRISIITYVRAWPKWAGAYVVGPHVYHAKPSPPPVFGVVAVVVVVVTAAAVGVGIGSIRPVKVLYNSSLLPCDDNDVDVLVAAVPPSLLVLDETKRRTASNLRPAWLLDVEVLLDVVE